VEESHQTSCLLAWAATKFVNYQKIWSGRESWEERFCV